MEMQIKARTQTADGEIVGMLTCEAGQYACKDARMVPPPQTAVTDEMLAMTAFVAHKNPGVTVACEFHNVGLTLIAKIVLGPDDVPTRTYFFGLHKTGGRYIRSNIVAVAQPAAAT